MSNTAALRALHSTRADMIANTVASWAVQLPLAWAAVTEWAVRRMLGVGA
ncbi:hypothetical protein ACGFY9_06400 [Streptomyces sp. NPDC048504]